eukprot:6193117-Pleurochrysis_carterae.AAC.2
MMISHSPGKPQSHTIPQNFTFLFSSYVSAVTFLPDEPGEFRIPRIGTSPGAINKYLDTSLKLRLCVKSARANGTKAQPTD